MGRSPCCDKVGTKKGVWTPEEDNKLFTYMQQHAHGNWRDLPLKAGTYIIRWSRIARHLPKRTNNEIKN
ncbi:hypothetical protein MIMGU_mgv11b021216mg [Erythranthe guttata]|uniref:Uncharacterized protein n=1 Tax=Erythranthe guttata TaxID=4155 RepID=A0A022QME8_ERYGU|nr:hypothetical protein MIMGU_mgv11b021216mg [Erythranthe guttata]